MSQFPRAITIARAAAIVVASAALVALVAIIAFAQPGVADARSGGISLNGAHDQKAQKKHQARHAKRTRRAKRKLRRRRLNAKYRRVWRHTSKRNKRWARRTAECESGGNPKAIGGGGKYRGAFQFLKSTWRTSPRSPGGDPIRYPYRTQAVVAVALKKRDGRGHWPVCG